MNKQKMSRAAVKVTVMLALIAAVSGCGSGGGNSGGGGGNAAVQPLVPGAGTGVGGLGRGPIPLDLQTVANFAVFAETTIANTPPSSVTGNVGLSPASGSEIHLSCSEVTGTIYATTTGGPSCARRDPTRLQTAVDQAIQAYNDGIGRAPDYVDVAGGNIGGQVLPPAVYKWNGSVRIPTNLTLKGGPNDVWILIASEDLTVGSGVQIVLEGGALPQNIYWLTLVHGFDIGAGALFQGTILAETSIAMGTGASINGRLLAATAITLDQNTVVLP